MTTDKFRVSSLPSATSGVVWVKPTSSVREASSLMLLHDYSQLPVMTTERTVKGIVSWKTLGAATRLGNSPALVRDCMDKNVTVLPLDAHVIEAVKKVIESDFVLVSDQSQKISGICTVFDIGKLFLAHSEPFIEIEQIELSLRQMIGRVLTTDDLQQIAGRMKSQPIASIEDLTFGGYVTWLENDSNWTRLDIDIDRRTFIERLKVINRIRNTLMHFRTQGLAEEELAELRKASKFFRLLRKVTSTG